MELASPVVATADIGWLQAIVLAVIQGLTEFLPVSSSGHLNIFSQLFWNVDAGSGYTAVVQIGTELAVLVYFWKDIVRIVKIWFQGIVDPSVRSHTDYKMGWFVIVGTIPIVIIGLAFQDYIDTTLRSLWITAIVLILFSFVFIWAERVGSKKRTEEDLTWKDALAVGAAQCMALIPGVSRSGGAISISLFLGINRETAARFSFLLAIPAVLGSGLYKLPDALSGADGGQSASIPQLLVGTGVAFIVGYAAIAWFLKFVANHTLSWFALYRILLGLFVIGLLSFGVISAT